MAEPTWFPGVGIYAHRDAYNVLYGDWHVKMFSDLKQQFSYWPNNTLWPVGNAFDYEGKMFGTEVNMLADCTDVTHAAIGGPVNWQVQYGGSELAWHLLDLDAGIDATAPQ
jgi:prepilin-type processing-associated H-X9-DG protein